MKIRMKDIAKMANVSEAAVSLVLNDKPSRISEKKKKEIKAIAQELNYVPNMAAQSLAKKSSQTIGIVIPDIENPFFSKLCKQLEEQFRALGYLTIIVNTNDEFAIEKKLIQMLLNRGVDGLIMVLSNESFASKTEQTAFLKAIDRPFVLVDRYVVMDEVNQVYFDHVAGAKMAASYLLESGHENIALMTGDLNLPSTLDKVAGYQQALAYYHQPVPQNYLIETGYRFKDGIEKTAQLTTLEEVTAVMATNDMVALGVMKQLKQLGYKIPETISIVGYDRLEVADFFDLALTTVEQNTPLLAEKSVELLKNILDEKITAPQTIVLPPQLFEGKSVKKIN